MERQKLSLACSVRSRTYISVYLKALLPQVSTGRFSKHRDSDEEGRAGGGGVSGGSYPVLLPNATFDFCWLKGDCLSKLLNSPTIWTPFRPIYSESNLFQTNTTMLWLLADELGH